MSADDIAEKLFRKLSASRRRAFAPSKAGDGLWDAYLDAVEDEDKASTESWNGSTTGILTFTGLFAATVAAFVIESYQMLQPDPGAQVTSTGNQNTALLVQIVQILSANQTTPVVALPDLQPAPFEAPQAAVIVNTLWFLSLVISLICALLATLIQEWTRDFLRDIQRRTPDMTIKEYAYNHIYVRMGVEHFKLDYVTSLIVALMHVAVVLFLIGLAMFLFPIHHTPAIVVEAFGIVAAAIYVIFSVMPIWDNSFPYRTPLTYALAAIRWSGVALLFALMSPVLYIIVIIADSAHKRWWTSRFKEVLALLLGVIRYRFYAWIPTRRLPGHRIPAHIPVIEILDSSHDAELREKHFVDSKRLLFLWAHASEYLLSPEGAHVLLNQRILAINFHDFSDFFLYLQRHPEIISRMAERMESVVSPQEGNQALQLLRALITAEGLLSAIDYAEDERWNCMHSVIPLLPRIAQAIVSTADAANAHDQITVLVALSELRQTVIVTRAQVARDLIAQGFTHSDDLTFLNKMLLALGEIRGFGMIPLYSDTLSITEKEKVRDISWHYELAVQNALTLLLNVIHIDKNAVLSKVGFLPIMMSWHTLSTEKGFAAFSETSRARQPTKEIEALFFSQAHDYAGILTSFASLFTLSKPGPPQLYRSEIEAEQTLKNIDLVFPPKPTDHHRSPSSPSPEDEPGTIKDKPIIEVVLTSQELERLGIRVIVAHTDTLDGLPADRSLFQHSSNLQQIALVPEPQAEDGKETGMSRRGQDMSASESVVLRAVPLDDTGGAASSIASVDESAATLKGNARPSRELNGLYMSPSRIDTGDHATVGTAVTSTSFGIAAALQVPLPPSPNGHDGETSGSSHTSLASMHADERLPDSPSLRSAEEGTFGVGNGETDS